jgi:hypothetical protein
MGGSDDPIYGVYRREVRSYGHIEGRKKPLAAFI